MLDHEYEFTKCLSNPLHLKTQGTTASVEQEEGQMPPISVFSFDSEDSDSRKSKGKISISAYYPNHFLGYTTSGPV